jgi:hypothetical protein
MPTWDCIHGDGFCGGAMDGLLASRRWLLRLPTHAKCNFRSQASGFVVSSCRGPSRTMTRTNHTASRGSVHPKRPTCIMNCRSPRWAMASTTTYIQWLHIAYLRGLAISNRRPPFFHCRLFQLHLGEGAPMHGDSSRCLPVLIARHVLTACRLLTTTDIENTWNIWSTTQMFSLFFSSSGHSRRIVLAVLHALPYHFLCREMQPPPHIYIDEMSELIMFGATTTRITLCVPFTIA